MKKLFENSTIKIVTVYVSWRAGLFLTGYLAEKLLPFNFSFPYWDTILAPTRLPQWLWSWGNFDGVHYLTLASRGYDGFGTQVFFPFFPVLVNLLSRLIGSYFLSAFIISNVSILLAGIVFFRLVRKHFDEKTAMWSVLFLFAFPSSLFFGAIYSESLFLLLVLLSFYSSGLMAGIIGALAGISRLLGFFVGPSLVLGKKRNWWGILSLSGLGIYMLYLWVRFDRPLFFLTAQSAFQNNRATSLSTLVSPFQVVFRYLKIFTTVDVFSYSFMIAFFEFSAFFFGIFTLGWLTIKRKIPREWLLFSWIALILPSLSGTLSSMPRYLITIFPLYISLALINNRAIKVVTLVVMIVLLGLCTVLFTRGYFVS